MVVAVDPVWGPLVTEVDVDLAVVTTLRLWLPMYLAQAERERDLAAGTLARPKAGAYTNTIEDDEFHDHPLPAIIVTTANTTAAPAQASDSSYEGAWRVMVSSVVRGRTPPETRAVAALFSASVRRVLTQQASLGGLSSEVVWVSSGLQPVYDNTDQGRYIAAGMNEFVVYVDNVLAPELGPGGAPYTPPDPENEPDLPLDPLSAVATVNVSIEPTV
ncbi:hypothetical protein UFOVP1313_9 [uncultured Caudovirales phage]|uniref:Uncharacterized protein n=1 Tax=uncultured Caudovirales phage TaxID=2100421 RepID=A0A6J5RIP0_9CAUD|nr:hypothetical protein UFOVP1313_9 [uncultured Caudovirales phage]